MTMSFDGQSSEGPYKDIYRPLGMLTRDQRTVMTREESKRETRSRQTPLLRQSSKAACYSRDFKKQFFEMCEIPGTNSCVPKVKKDLNSGQTALKESNDSQRKLTTNLSSNHHFISQSQDNSIGHHHIRQYRRSRYGVSMFSKFFEVVATFCVVGFFLECSGAPTTMERHSPPKWLNPCNTKGSSDTNMDSPPASDLDVLQPIRTVAIAALYQATKFKEEFVKKKFNTTFDKHHQSMHDQRYDWLPERKDIPKDLGENLSIDHLQSLEGRVDDTLRNVSHYLQRFAVGFEQVVEDQRNLERLDEDVGFFVDKFTELEGHLNIVLCEVQSGMSLRKIQRPEDLTRDIMSSEFRELLNNRTHRNLRDWVIYRDYINALEYIVQVMEHLVTKAMEESNAE